MLCSSKAIIVVSIDTSDVIVVVVVLLVRCSVQREEGRGQSRLPSWVSLVDNRT